MPLLSPKSLTNREVLGAGGKKLSRLRWSIIVDEVAPEIRAKEQVVVLYRYLIRQSSTLVKASLRVGVLTKGESGLHGTITFTTITITTVLCTGGSVNMVNILRRAEEARLSKKCRSNGSLVILSQRTFQSYPPFSTRPITDTRYVGTAAESVG